MALSACYRRQQVTEGVYHAHCITLEWSGPCAWQGSPTHQPGPIGVLIPSSFSTPQCGEINLMDKPRGAEGPRTTCILHYSNTSRMRLDEKRMRFIHHVYYKHTYQMRDIGEKFIHKINLNRQVLYESKATVHVLGTGLPGWSDCQCTRSVTYVTKKQNMNTENIFLKGDKGLRD